MTFDLDLDIPNEEEKDPFDIKGKTYSILVTEMALTGDKSYSCTKAGVKIEDLEKLLETDRFKKDIQDIKDEYQKDGVSPFEAKSKILAYISLDEISEIMLNKTEKASDRISAAKLLMQTGGLLTKEEENKGISVSFNFGEIDPLKENKKALEKLQLRLNKDKKED